MRHALTRPVFYLLGALLSFTLAPSAGAAGKGYDVSYLWHREVNSVLDYRERVARVLGPRAAKRLKVVAKGKLYGLIYARGGDSAGAARVAKSHTRLLRSRGLEAASPVRSQNWQYVGEDGVRQASAGSASTPSVPRSRMTKSERRQEIRDLEAAVEDYINRHHHLPHMPSAAEVEGTGAELGELNKRLLRTVEELTLHVISQSKEIDRQQHALARLERRLWALVDEQP